MSTKKNKPLLHCLLLCPLPATSLHSSSASVSSIPILLIKVTMLSSIMPEIFSFSAAASTIFLDSGEWCYTMLQLLPVSPVFCFSDLVLSLSASWTCKHHLAVTVLGYGTHAKPHFMNSSKEMAPEWSLNDRMPLIPHRTINLHQNEGEAKRCLMKFASL